ncbi:MAG: metal ABC transporter ATP-binding protein [Richelia sp. RM2_1_2]|nr:metal ABC transporter ATP-binding protein [Richelia sp. SM1_7_0]NJN09343.1 metal ABC transporter ATP-binding protein [Richelia sp. RM1_1_1]NJO28394.1 metal ABC transporter ATP-binding protein [Richelia sp. SL_2_1]NJO59004.1 metal ABC transporter ATP-binding protein [Richelia sp. RM2_1_2]
MLEVEHLDVDYRGVVAVEDVSFRVFPGQMVGVIGPNGAGKSTLVKAILGLIPVSDGTIKFCNCPIHKQLRSIAYVPQRTQVDWDYPITVQNVVMMARTVTTGWFRKPSHKSKEIVKSALHRVGMWEFRSRQIGELSGGQQQRVFLARALAQQADLLFFDEPFVGIDKTTEDIMFDIFDELRRDGKILILITHDLGETLAQCDSLLLLNKHIIADGSMKEVVTSENLQRAYGNNILFLNRQEKSA